MSYERAFSSVHFTKWETVQESTMYYAEAGTRTHDRFFLKSHTTESISNLKRSCSYFHETFILERNKMLSSEIDML
jgi:hypothetical protein